MDRTRLNQLLDKLKKDEPIHVALENRGELRIDKPVPFLLVYRIPDGQKDNFTSTLGKTESSYLMASDTEDFPVRSLIHTITTTLSDRFNGFLLLEVWLSERADPASFTIHLSQKGALPIADKMREELGGIQVGHEKLDAELQKGKDMPCPPRFEPLMTDEESRKKEITVVGLEVAPIYLDSTTGTPYPLFLRELREGFGKALRKSFFEFVRLKTSHNATHFEMLGTTEIDGLVWEIDAKLAEYSNLFDFLFLVTPINSKESWESFKKSRYMEKPSFHYRPMPIDPELIKRKLFNLPIERVSDPTIAYLFRDKRKEIDRMLNMMEEREKPGFMHSSIQIFGGVDAKLRDVAQAILVATEPPSRVGSKREVVGAVEFARLAEAELKYLKEQYPEVSTAVRVRDDIEGVLVSRGTLHISSRYSISRDRAFALIQHEVGTHVATYYNGKAQPLKLFYLGVPGYEQLQEGLAVFAEFLSGGLTNERLRVLAARVLVVDGMVKGKGFSEMFSMLVDKHAFLPESAFYITMRVYRGGGLTKDGVYLKGLLNMVEYARKGNDITKLLVGKIRQDYLPVIEELTHRQLLRPAPIRPRYLEPPYIDNVEKVRGPGSIFRMLY